MTIDELVSEISLRPPAAVPTLLARHTPWILPNLEDLVERLLARPTPSRAFSVARLWLAALHLTQDILLEDTSGRPVPSPFGELLFAVVALRALHEDMPAAGTAIAAPTEDDLGRLDAELWRQVTDDDPRDFHALLLAWITRAAMGLAPAALGRAREELAATALVLAEHLEAIAAPSDEDVFRAEASALRIAAGGCIPPDAFAWARDRATQAYVALYLSRDPGRFASRLSDEGVG